MRDESESEQEAQHRRRRQASCRRRGLNARAVMSVLFELFWSELA
jgi:hypothetical protein